MKKRFILFCILSGLLVISLVVYLNPTSGVVEAGEAFTLDVEPDLTTFDIVDPDGNGEGPFFIQGPIYPEGTLDENGNAPPGSVPIGQFFCWGWLYHGGEFAVVSQEFQLNGLGEIQVQGNEDDRRAVVGGTGVFKDVRGVGFAKFLNFPTNVSFTIDFDLD
ncbi:MAG: hypothetical protein D6723_05855 [Acidobacteria bacterium]|nr:MAG: hypothetical protein D6723_05855 [Acidobacteriota bacterium]